MVLATSSDARGEPEGRGISWRWSAARWADEVKAAVNAQPWNACDYILLGSEKTSAAVVNLWQTHAWV